VPGRITDELRRITREQGADLAPGPQSEPGAADSPRRRYGPLLALLGVLVLTGLGWLLVRQLMADSKLQDCVMSGRKNCVPLDVDGAAP
jgi:hypothetical protein